MKKQTQLFLLESDEEEISQQMRVQHPTIAFVDDNVWSSPEPVVRDSIAHCVSSLVYVWDKALIERLPTLRRKDGRFEGPIAGVVIQIVRSRLEESTLLSGRLAVGTGGSVDLDTTRAIASLFSQINRIVKKMTVAVRAVNPLTRHPISLVAAEYRSGRYAAEWVSAVVSRKLRDRSTQNYFFPAPSGIPIGCGAQKPHPGTLIGTR